MTAREAAAASGAVGKKATRARSATAGTPRAAARKAGVTATPARSGTISKVSVSMPTGLAASVREVAGPGRFSAYVADAVERSLALDRLAAYVAEVETELGRPISDELMAEADAAWHGD